MKPRLNPALPQAIRSWLTAWTNCRRAAKCKCPANPKLAKDGKTIYVVPVGERTIFDGKEGTKIFKITDGTSNTVMVVDVMPENAVIWSKPDDWSFLVKDPGAGLLEGKREQFLAAYADGSVRALPTNIDRGDLRRLMQKDDGEVLSKQY